MIRTRIRNAFVVSISSLINRTTTRRQKVPFIIGTRCLRVCCTVTMSKRKGWDKRRAHIPRQWRRNHLIDYHRFISVRNTTPKMGRRRVRLCIRRSCDAAQAKTWHHNQPGYGRDTRKAGISSQTTSYTSLMKART